MKPAHPAESPAPASGPSRTRSFRNHGTGPRLTREQEKRQNDVLQSAWRHFGMPGPVIAFLNTRNEQLQGQPLHLAVQSDEGLIQVERLLGEMTLRA